jgi:hypothetical protein
VSCTTGILEQGDARSDIFGRDRSLIIGTSVCMSSFTTPTTRRKLAVASQLAPSTIVARERFPLPPCDTLMGLGRRARTRAGDLGARARGQHHKRNMKLDQNQKTTDQEKRLSDARRYRIPSGVFVQTGLGLDVSPNPAIVETEART